MKKIIFRILVGVVTAFIFASMSPAWGGGTDNGNNGTGMVRLNGFSLKDGNGNFLGLGATYFLALRHMVYDPGLLEANLTFLRSQGFKYVRMLSMVGGHPFWEGRELSPVPFYNRLGQYMPETPGYWEKFAQLVDWAYDQAGIRIQITIFADAQDIMPEKTDRLNHINNIMDQIVRGREEKIILLEVSNEYYQNGLQLDELKEYGNLIAGQTDILVALSSPVSGKFAVYDTYSGTTGIDIGTVHFSRSGGWDSVYDCEDVYSYADPLEIKISSNEPLGPGASRRSECDPMRLVMAAVYAWSNRLPIYCLHSAVGVRGWYNHRPRRNCGKILDNPLLFQEFFEKLNLMNKFKHLIDFLPPDLAHWKIRLPGHPQSPFRYQGNAAQRCLSKIRSDDFYTMVLGLTDGAMLQARINLGSLEVYNPTALDQGPLPGYPTALNADETITLSSAVNAYILKEKIKKMP